VWSPGTWSGEENANGEGMAREAQTGGRVEVDGPGGYQGSGVNRVIDGTKIQAEQKILMNEFAERKKTEEIEKILCLLLAVLEECRKRSSLTCLYVIEANPSVPAI